MANGMVLENFILATVTTKKNTVVTGMNIFLCDSKEEMEDIASKLEAILDGIAHQLTDDLFIIVKH